jgi:septum formation protein
MTRLILASSSPYRSELLSRLGLAFEILAPRIDESPGPGEDALLVAQRLAREKAGAAAAQIRGTEGLIVAADQAAALDGTILGKPGGFEAALEQLLACQGREVLFHTAVTVRDEPSGRQRHGVDTTKVRFLTHAPQQLSRYLELERPFDCAGGFKAEGLGIALFDAIETRDPSGLLGLPLIWLSQVLREFGFDPLDARSR